MARRHNHPAGPAHGAACVAGRQAAAQAAADPARRARHDAMSHRATADLFTAWAAEADDPDTRRRFLADAEVYAALAAEAEARAAHHPQED